MCGGSAERVAESLRPHEEQQGHQGGFLREGQMLFDGGAVRALSRKSREGQCKKELAYGLLRRQQCALIRRMWTLGLEEDGKGEATKKGETGEGFVDHRKPRKGMYRLTHKMATLTLLWRHGGQDWTSRC